MGADTFICHVRGDTARAAFTDAVQDACYEHGHGGYTGTIAEKTGFVTIELPEGADPYTEADRLIDDDDERIADKWGPAGCFDLGEHPSPLGKRHYLFFGWAPE